MACFIERTTCRLDGLPWLTKPARAFDLGHGGKLLLHQIGQGQILEEEIHEFFLRQLEHEVVHALALRPAATAAAFPLAAFGAVHPVAADELAVAGQHDVAAATGAVVKDRLGHVL